MKTGLMICGEVDRWADTLEQATVAEDLGYDSVWLAEHHFLEGSYAPTPLLTLAALSAVTHEVSLGTAVLLAPFYHPVRLAEETALIQSMSGGRFICGVGLGYREEEFSGFGVPRSLRRHYLEETVVLLRQLWTQEHVTFQGRVRRVEDVTVTPRPQPVPPIWMGGWAEPALDRAARLADAWFPGPTADLNKLRECYAFYDGVDKPQGDVPRDRPLIREIWIGETDAEVEYGRQHLVPMYEGEYRAFGQENVGPGDVLRDRAFVGSPQEVAEGLARWREEFEFDHIIGRMHLHGSEQRAVLRSMELFAEHVRPVLAA